MSKKKLTFIVAILVLLFVAGGYGVYTLMNAQQAEITAVPSEDEIQQSLVKGNYDEARQAAERRLEDDASYENRITLAQVEVSAGEYKKAIELYEQEEMNLTHEEYSELAVAYELSGDIEKAIVAYRKTADMWPQDDPFYDAETRYLRNHANDLSEGGE